MNRLSAVKRGFDKAEVAIIISRLLAQQTNAGVLQPGPEELGSVLAGLAWKRKVNLVDDSEQWPPKIVIAAVALAQGYSHMRGPELQRALTIALSNVLAEIEVNNSRSLTPWDQQLVAEVTDVFAEMLEAYNKGAMAS